MGILEEYDNHIAGSIGGMVLVEECVVSIYVIIGAQTLSFW
jgi:hypothetical protein